MEVKPTIESDSVGSRGYTPGGDSRGLSSTDPFLPGRSVIAHPSWQLSGDYFETCSCNYLCPCILTNLAGQPTKGDCYFAFVFHIDQGRFGNVALDGINFAVVGHTPGVMANGNWSVSVITDKRATPEQRHALTTIASGQAGSPMAAIAPLIGTFLGVEVRPILYSRLALGRSMRSHLHVFGLNWDDTSGQNNGHFAPFNWQGS